MAGIMAEMHRYILLSENNTPNFTLQEGKTSASAEY